MNKYHKIREISIQRLLIYFILRLGTEELC